jgi:peptide/nickel transport system ATP-binding protein
MDNHRDSAKPVLSVRGLHVVYQSARGPVQAVRDVSFDLMPGETLAVIGESGCGKTTLALSLVRLLPKAARVTSGTIQFNKPEGPVDVLALSNERLRQFRWRDCAMVFQSALNALNPVIKISSMVQDTARAHGETDTKKIALRAMDLFAAVRLDPERVYNAYPHELSGGMRQRVLIALGVLLKPQVVIMDEPTTALDVLTQRTVIEVLKQLREQMNFSLIFISHDLSMAAELATRIMTMYAGSAVELGTVADAFYSPMHPYTLGLLHAAPTLHGSPDMLASIPGSPPNLIALPTGCTFHARCPYATEKCTTSVPPFAEHAPDHRSACHYWGKPLDARRAERAAFEAESADLAARAAAAGGQP